MRKYGHWGITLFLTTPLFVFFDLATASVITALAMLVTLLPNAEIGSFQSMNRGISHTVWAAFGMALIVGMCVYLLSTVVISAVNELEVISVIDVYSSYWGGIAFVGVFLGYCSHLIADVLISSPGKPPMKPFQPVFPTAIQMDISEPNNPLVNEGMLKFAVGIFVVVIVTQFLY